MAHTRRSFSGYAVITTLASAAGAGDTTLSIVASTGWPDGSSGKFYVRIDPGLSTEEKVLVTTRSGTTLQSVSRGQDGTAASAHSAGATVECCFAAVDLDEANYWVSELSGAATTAGDLPVADAANSLTKIAKGSNSTVFGVDSSGALGYGTVTSAQITDGTIVNGDINSSAGIALAKLESMATGYLIGNNSGSSAAPSSVATPAFWTATVTKASNESVSSSITPQDDDELLFATTSGVPYLVEINMVYASAAGGGTPDMIVQCGETSAKGGVTRLCNIKTDDTLDTSGTAFVYTDLSVSQRAGTATTKRLLTVEGWHIGQGGTFKVQWAQDTSSANATTVYAGSYIRYKALT